MTLLHESPDYLLACKPAGLLAVPGRGPDKQDCLLSRLQASHPEALTVHRLDQATSGLMVFARNANAQRRLGHAFERRLVHKRYVALVSGHTAVPSDAWNTIDLPLMRDWPQRPRQMVSAEGRAAQTRWRVLEAGLPGGLTRLELEPLTGRTHQLRVHLAHVGLPIVGDTLYGGAQAARLMLHACELGFEWNGERVQWRSPAPF